jgi:hypothetical protein
VTHSVAALPVSLAGAQAKKPVCRGTGIVFVIVPDTAKVTVDGAMHGPASGLADKGVMVAPGTHAVKIENGRDSIEVDVNVRRGQCLPFKYEFEDSGAKHVRKEEPPPPPAPKTEGEKAPPKPKDEIVDLPPEPPAE